MWPGSVRGFGCSCASAPGISSGMCWIERAAQRDVQQLLPAADAEHRPVGRHGVARDRKLEGGAAVLGGDARVARRRAEERGIDIERAAGDDEPLHQRQILRRLVGLVRQQDGHAARRRDGVAVILAQRVPGVGLGISAGRLTVEREADDGLRHAANLECRGLRWNRRASVELCPQRPVATACPTAPSFCICQIGASRPTMTYSGRGHASA